MSSITPAEGFLTTDGSFFLTANEANAHQHRLDLTEEVRNFVTIGDLYNIQGYTEMNAILKWEEHKKFEELKAREA
jgi:hypothetical protein